MTIYRLEPILLDHPSWQASSHWYGPLWVEATSEREAREKVADVTDTGVATRASPWYLAEVASCVPDDSGQIAPGDGVMKENGEYLYLDPDPDSDDD